MDRQMLQPCGLGFGAAVTEDDQTEYDTGEVIELSRNGFL
jgi:hypothetical protein